MEEHKYIREAEKQKAEISKMIKEAIQESGKSYYYLAKVTGAQINQIHAIENNTANYSAINVLKLFNALGIHFEITP